MNDVLSFKTGDYKHTHFVMSYLGIFSFLIFSLMLLYTVQTCYRLFSHGCECVCVCVSIMVIFF